MSRLHGLQRQMIANKSLKDSECFFDGDWLVLLIKIFNGTLSAMNGRSTQ